MQYKTLGDTGLLVSTLCFGTMTFHGGTGLFRAIGTVDQAGADQLVKASIDAGINFFDTADVYSEGESEKALGQSLKNLNITRSDVIIATKVFGRTGPGRNDVGASRGHRHGGMGVPGTAAGLAEHRDGSRWGRRDVGRADRASVPARVRFCGRRGHG